MNLTDIIAAARTGDRTAISALYDTYKTPVYYLCLKLTQNKEAAGQMLQRTFYHAFHKLNLLHDPEDFPKWIMAVAANRCKNFVKEQNPDLFDGDLPDDDQKCKFELPEPIALSASAENEEARAFLSRAVDNLPVLERFVVLMRFFGSMSETQTSRILECGDGTARRLLEKAMSTLSTAVRQKSKEIPVLKEFRAGEWYAVLARDSELARVPGFVAEEVAKNAPALVQNRKTTRECEEAAPAGGRRRANLWIPVLILVLGIAAIAGGFAVAGRIRQTPLQTDPVTTPPAAVTTTDPVTDSDTVDPVTSDLQSDTDVPEPPVTDDQPVTDDTTADTTPDPQPDPTPASAFTCKTVSGHVVITKYTGSDTRVVIPSSVSDMPVTEIGAGAFQGTAVTSVTVPSSVTVIGTQAFRDCTALTEVNLPASLVEIKAYAFRGCSALADITLPDSVKNVGPTCFGDTKWFSSQPAGFLTLGRGILIRYTAKEANVTVPSGVTALSNAFYYNAVVTSVTLPDTVTSIGQFAFTSCRKLTTITIPASVTSIDPQAIYDCTGLKTIVVKEGSYADTWCKQHDLGALVSYS